MNRFFNCFGERASMFAHPKKKFSSTMNGRNGTKEDKQCGKGREKKATEWSCLYGRLSIGGANVFIWLWRIVFVQRYKSQGINGNY